MVLHAVSKFCRVSLHAACQTDGKAVTAGPHKAVFLDKISARTFQSKAQCDI